MYSVGYQQKQVAPLDARLQLPESKFSHLLQSWDQLVATGQPHGQVSRVFETIFQLRQHTDSLERMSRRLAPDAEDFCWSRPTPPVEEEGEILVASADGKGYPELKTWALQWLRRIRELYAINRERLRHAPDSAAFADADACPGSPAIGICLGWSSSVAEGILPGWSRHPCREGLALFGQSRRGFGSGRSGLQR